MYGISKDLAVNENNYFDGGIHNGVIIEKINYENVKKDGTGKMVLAFHFKGTKGETFRHVEWPVDESDANAESKIVNMGKRIKHILSKFVPEADIVIGNVSTFEQYANEVIRIAGTNYEGKTFEIKLLVDDKNNIGFPKYVGFIAKDAGTLKVSNTEKITKTTATATANNDDFAPVAEAF
jgi:hypothetical protein